MMSGRAPASMHAAAASTSCIIVNAGSATRGEHRRQPRPSCLRSPSPSAHDRLARIAGRLAESLLFYFARLTALFRPRRKKTRCPGERPACAFCMRLGQQCTYADSSNSGKSDAAAPSPVSANRTSQVGRTLID